MEKLKTKGKTNWSQKTGTLTVGELKKELDKYDDEIPVSINAGYKYGAFFIESVYISNDWLHIGKRL
ncbi:hypothetical protein LCGC14_2741960 [marine sediment metagenome]|uniref:Uncharacterized protein n=1 Tax=marine sediment metagenome TaxID=412755 RepID=A0A0F8VA73_9ZZZZ